MKEEYVPRDVVFGLNEGLYQKKELGYVKRTEYKPLAPGELQRLNEACWCMALDRTFTKDI